MLDAGKLRSVESLSSARRLDAGKLRSVESLSSARCWMLVS